MRSNPMSLLMGKQARLELQEKHTHTNTTCEMGHQVVGKALGLLGNAY